MSIQFCWTYYSNGANWESRHFNAAPSPSTANMANSILAPHRDLQDDLTAQDAAAIRRFTAELCRQARLHVNWSFKSGCF